MFLPAHQHLSCENRVANSWWVVGVISSPKHLSSTWRSGKYCVSGKSKHQTFGFMLDTIPSQYRDTTPSQYRDTTPS